jgi:uncharacterized protein
LTVKRSKLRAPAWLTAGRGRRTSPVYFIDFNELGIDVETPAGREKASAGIHSILQRIMPEAPLRPALIKIHPGEPKSKTHLIPELMAGQADFLRRGGVEPVLGDSTVLYTGLRGYKSNTAGDVSPYMEVIRKNGWDRKSTGMDFVVIDRPVSSFRDIFEFEEEEIMKEVDSPGCFKGVYVSGGFEKAGTILNNAHLTLHGMTPLALCVKALTMGCAGASGKKQMHMNLAPKIDPERCRACGLCIKSCPFGALYESDEGVPTLLPEKCAGCGECLAVCPGKAITMFHSGSIAWGRGKSSFPTRLGDFLLSMMNGKWGGIVHIGHLYRITAQCDCMDIVQKPIMADIGIIASRNPFAADRLAAELFTERAAVEGKNFPLEGYLESFDYIEENYNMITKPEVVKL